jgi:signal transduction histidine kinase
MSKTNDITTELEKECLSIRNIGHDINNALAGILGYSELLLEDEREDKAHYYLTTIREKSKAMMLLMKVLSAHVRDLQSKGDVLDPSEFKSMLMQYSMKSSDQLKRLLDDTDASVNAFKAMDHLDERTLRFQQRFLELMAKLHAQCKLLHDESLKRS